ncbi:MFS transporter [Gulosibacter chungangensis]|uniref:MFS transporter n=2 Tax=Gulosibacter chungangensis TaxID=979746 RepID=A0A7J5B8I7_9MICO|nr:MFS transporter [Gulosibacter chungangensis]
MTSKLPLGPLFTLATAIFMSITIEMLPTGLMHLMARDLGVNDGQIGLLMSVFAFAVVITSTPLTMLLRNIPKRYLLVGVLTFFSLSTVMTALAPTYALVLVSRIINGVAHGVFWSSVTSYTGSLVAPQHLTKAVSITGGGGGLAFVLGVPLGTALGQWLDWRTTFIVLAVVCLIVAAALWKVLPQGIGDRPAPATTAVELPTPQALSDVEAITASIPIARRPRKSMGLVIVLCVLVMTVMTGHYSFYSYISPYLLGPVGLAEVLLPIALFGYGIASALATGLTGALFTGRAGLGFYVAFGLFVFGGGSLALFAGVPVIPLIGLGLWGFGMGFLPTLLQSRLLAIAPSKHRDLASAIYTSAFNGGIGLGALVGALLLDQYGMGALGVSFLTLTIVGVIINVVVDLKTVRERSA